MTHLYASDPRDPKRPRSIAPCRHCEATAAGCDANLWLRGRACCDRCPGDHDTEETPA